VQRQREDCIALAAKLGWTVVEVYEDNDRGASTKSRKPRKRYQQMLADAKVGKFSTVIAYTSGRLTRRPREHEDQIDLAEHYGISFRYVSSPDFDLNTAAGRLIARILAANDAGEAEGISERVQRETLQRAQQGRPHGGPRPYGYTADGRELVPEEAARIAEWYATLLAGGKIHGILKRLSRDGVLTPAGKPWHYSSIRAILRNERNAGLRILHGEIYPAVGPAIVSEETWRAATALLTDPSRRTNFHGTARKWLGAGLYLCDRCSQDQTAQRVQTFYANFKGTSYRTYQCKACHRTWKAEPIDEWVTQLIAARLSREDVADLLVRPGSRPDVVALRTEAMGVRERLTQLAEEFADGELTAEQLRVATTKLRGRLEELEQQIAQAGQSGALAALALADDPVAAWLALGEGDTDRRQAILRGLATIRLDAPLRGRVRWDAEKFITVDWKTHA
jgi:DNA invertase Pin-like site-specific DNA recombinase